MSRVEIQYGGTLYTVVDRTAEQIRAQIDDALAAGRTLWLSVNRGEGLPRETTLLIHAGIAVAIGSVQESIGSARETIGSAQEN
ncbi:hypothetical protein HQQ81_13930 [Microbacteriaceae bacterium VKM Ac-2854]|nr:hypothetical protein [Microbacteriaceae bacterium VKM Ac-2854]